MTTENQTPRFADFGKRFTALLTARANNNKSECARAMGCTPQAVSKWAAGEQMPRGDQMEKLAAWLYTTPGYLRFGESTDELPPAPEPKFILMYVDADLEVPLLNDFRLGTDLGKRQLLAAAKRMEKRPSDEWPAEPSSSAD